MLVYSPAINTQMVQFSGPEEPFLYLPYALSHPYSENQRGNRPNCRTGRTAQFLLSICLIPFKKVVMNTAFRLNKKKS